MPVESRRESRWRRRLAPARMPDPLRAHGAWVYLAVSTLAGVLTVAPPGRGPALLAAGGFAGLFLLAGALAAGGRRARLTRLAAGLSLAVGAPLLALALGAGRSFLLVGLLAVPPALAAARFAGRQGFLSPAALGSGVLVLAVSAAAAASAGGAPPLQVLSLLALLAPFFLWRTWRLARALGQGWTKERFRRRGLLESGLAVAWAAASVAAARMLF